MADLDRLLLSTSRTFALAIPCLPEPPRREVGTAYLLFRIADAFEDAGRWPREDRLAALGDLGALLRDPSRARAPQLARRWVAARPCDEEGYLELLGETPGVLAELDGFTPARREIIVRHALRTAEGMAGFVVRADDLGGLKLSSVPELKGYCYVVAGIVGELLTDLFLDVEPALEKIAPLLRTRSVAFGEGLQLVNILKDSEADARDGRVYLPDGVPRREIFGMARTDLQAAGEYVLGLQQAGAPRGFVEFTALPVLLAHASLGKIERAGPGSKISRAEVALLVDGLRRDLDAGRPAVSLDDRDKE